VVTSGSEDSGVLEGAVARALLAELVAALKADPVLRRDVVALLQPTRSPSTSDERLMTVAEVAAAVKLSERSVYRALRNGRLRGDRVGSSWRISSAAVDEWKAAARCERRRGRCLGDPRTTTLPAALSRRSIAWK